MAIGIIKYVQKLFEKDEAVTLVAQDPALTAELILLFRIILADGVVREAELETFKRICETAFGIKPESLNDVYRYLQDFGYETTAEQAAAMFAELPEERRQALLQHMIEIAKADESLAPQELTLLKRTADLLGFEVAGPQAG